VFSLRISFACKAYHIGCCFLKFYINFALFFFHGLASFFCRRTDTWTDTSYIFCAVSMIVEAYHSFSFSYTPVFVSQKRSVPCKIYNILIIGKTAPFFSHVLPQKILSDLSTIDQPVFTYLNFAKIYILQSKAISLASNP
jgi:hypothetical protein